MSAYIALYDIAPNVYWVPGNYYKFKPSEITKELQEQSTKIYLDICIEADNKFGKDESAEKDEWIKKECTEKDPLDMGHFNIDGEFEEINLSKCKVSCAHRDRRLYKYILQMKEYFKSYILQHKCKALNYKYLVIEERMYSQGWFFKKELFKTTNSIFFAFDKPSALKLLDRFIATNDEEGYGKDTYETFKNTILKYKDDEHFVLKIIW